MDTQKIVEPAINAVKTGETKIYPKQDEKVYFHWLENIEPWCISRQLWWGHQIPIWYDDDGNEYCAHNAEEAQKIIEGLTRKVHEGEIFSGVVTRIIPIGAFVEILPGKEGMVHISQLSEARVERVEDVVRQGDEVTVRVREIDSRGRINLTLRGVGQNNGMSYPEPTPTPVAPLN